MIITVECPSCVTSFPVDTDKVPESGVSARCSICASIFRVERPTAQHEDGGAEAPSEATEATAVSTATAVVDSETEEDWSDDEALEDPVVEGDWDTEVEPDPQAAGTDTLDVAPTVEEAWDSEVGSEPSTESWEEDTGGSMESWSEPEPAAEPEPATDPEPFVEAESVEAPEHGEGSEPGEEELEPMAHSEPSPETEADWRLSEVDDPEEGTDAPDFDLVDTSIEVDQETPAEPVSETGFEIELPEPETTSDPRQPERPGDETAPEATETDAVPAPSEPPPAFQFGKRDPHEKAQRLARVLVSDMIMYNPERHDHALAAGTLKDDFDDEIKKSWEEYVDQVGEQIARSTPYFTDALNDILARGEDVFDDTVVA